VSTLSKRRAVISLVVVAFALLGLNLLFTARYVNSTHAKFEQQQAAQQAAQRRAGELVGRAICTTLGKLAALKPPAGSAAANPSRAYEQQLHATLDQLGPDLGCK
jgi:hypothetical protein